MQNIEASKIKPPFQSKDGPSSSGFLRKLKRPWQMFLMFVELPFRFVFGRDLFISYSRSDSRKYAPNLALVLQKRMPKLSFYLDRWIAPPSGKLPLSLRLQLRWSSIMVVICTQNAIGSNFVKDEVSRFATLGRKVLTVDVNGVFNAVRGEEPWVGFSGADPEEESIEAIQNGAPSDHVVERILKMVEFTTQDRRLRRAIWGTLMFVVLSVGGAAAYSIVTVRAANKQVAGARQQAKEAEEKAKEANESAQLAADREVTARQAKDDAERSAREADDKAKAAENLRVSAEAKASEALEKERNALAEATRQQNLAMAGRLAADNILAPEPVLEQVEKKVLFTIESLRRAPSSTAYRNLIEGIKMMPRALDTAVHDGPVKDAFFSADGRYMVIVAGNSLFVRSVAGLSRNGKFGAAQKISDGERITVAKFSPNGKYLAAASNSRVHLWRAATMQKLQPIEQKQIKAIAFTEDGELIALGGENTNASSEAVQKTASVWRLTDSGHTEVASALSLDTVVDVSFSPDKLLFTTLSSEGLNIWKTTGGPQALANPKRESDPDTLQTGGFSPNGRYLFRTDLFDRTYAKILRADTRKGVFSRQMDFIRFSPDGRFLVTSSSDDESDRRETHVWDAYSDEFKELSRINYRSIIRNGEFSRDGKLLALVSLEQDSAEIWDTLSGRLLTYVKLKQESGALAFSPDSKYFAASSGNEVTVWPLARDWKTGEISHRESPVIALSPDGQLIGVTDGATVRLLSVSNGREVSSVATRCEVTSLAFDWQGRRFATAGKDCGVWVWEPNTRNGALVQPKRAQRPYVSQLSFTQDGMHLALADDKGVWLHKIGGSSRSLFVRKDHESFLGLSPDGRHIVTVNEHVASIWDTHAPNKNPVQIEHPFLNSDTNWLTAAFTRDGQLVTADNYVVRIWDIHGPNPLEIGKVVLQEGSAPEMAFPVLSPNGEFVARGVTVDGDNYKTTVWPLQRDALIATACRRLSRPLSVEEWVSAFGTKRYGETCSGLKLPIPEQ